MNRKEHIPRLWACWSVLLLGLLVLGGCDYARMKEQEALRTYKGRLPEMPARSIPVDGGIAQLRKADPKTLQNPLPFNVAVVDRGWDVYSIYCIMCHGPNLDGNGRVGQSFQPLPTNLRDPKLWAQTDGELFFRLTFGFKRQPPLADTIEESDRWAVVHFIRSLTTPPPAGDRTALNEWGLRNPFWTLAIPAETTLTNLPKRF